MSSTKMAKSPTILGKRGFQLEASKYEAKPTEPPLQGRKTYQEVVKAVIYRYNKSESFDDQRTQMLTRVQVIYQLLQITLLRSTPEYKLNREDWLRRSKMVKVIIAPPFAVIRLF